MIQDRRKSCIQQVVIENGELNFLQGEDLVLERIPVCLGINGTTENKREGDGKTPIGTFPLGVAFGDEGHRQYARHLPYLRVEEGLECVDDPDSKYYNQFVTAETLPRDWKSSENMVAFGSAYALGIVVHYNWPFALKGKGSCIFVHIGDQGTAGCVAMSREDLIRVVMRLDADKYPTITVL